VSGQKWWAQLTTSRLLSWPVLLLVTLGGSTSFLTGNTVVNSPSTLLAVAAAVGAMVVFFITVVALHPLAIRVVTPGGPIVTTVIVAIIAAVVRGVFVWWAYQAVFDADEVWLAERIMSSVLAIVPIAITHALAALALNVYRTAQHETDTLTAQKTLIGPAAREYTRQFTSETVTATRQNLVDIVTLLRSADAVQRPDEILAMMKSTLEQVVKPLSRVLSLTKDTVPIPTAPRLFPRIDRHALAHNAWLPSPRAPLILGVIFAIGVIPSLSESLPGAGAAVAASLWGVAIVAIFWVHKITTRTFPDTWSLPVRYALVGLAAISGALLLWAVVHGILTPLLTLPDPATSLLSRLSLFLPLPLGLLMVIRAFAMQLDETLTRRDALAAEVRREITRGNELYWQRRQALSHALHGPIQAALNAAELRLRQALTDGHWTEEMAESIAQTVEENMATLAQLDHTTTDVTLVLERTRLMWAGLCDVSWEAPPGFLDQLSNTHEGAGVAEILVEGVFNAVRHGEASQVHIVFAPTISQDGDDLLHLSMSNDGVAAPPTPTPGQGSALLDLLSSQWTLTTDSTPNSLHTRLLIEIPLGQPTP